MKNVLNERDLMHACLECAFVLCDMFKNGGTPIAGNVSIRELPISDAIAAINLYLREPTIDRDELGEMLAFSINQYGIGPCAAIEIAHNLYHMVTDRPKDEPAN